MKKLSNNDGVIKSSILAGQRELLREYRNKINEIIDEMELIKNIRIDDMSDHLLEWHIVEKPYTAMRSTGESDLCDLCDGTGSVNMSPSSNGHQMELCPKCLAKPIKPQKNVREKIRDIIHDYVIGNDDVEKMLAEKILAIVKGE